MNKVQSLSQCYSLPTLKVSEIVIARALSISQYILNRAGSQETKEWNKIDDSISLVAITEGLTKGSYWPKLSIMLVKKAGLKNF